MLPRTSCLRRTDEHPVCQALTSPGRGCEAAADQTPVGVVGLLGVFSHGGRDPSKARIQGVKSVD